MRDVNRIIQQLNNPESCEEYKPNGNGTQQDWESRFERQEHRIILLQQQINELALRCEVVSDLAQRIAQLERNRMASRQKPIIGLMPSQSAVQRATCQIFYNPSLTAKECRSGWTVWRIKMEAYDADGTRLAEFYINTAPSQDHRTKYQKAYATASNEMRQFLDPAAPAYHGHQGHVIGILKTTTSGGGSRWCGDHAAVMVGHGNEKPHVYALLNDGFYEWHEFKSPSGVDAVAKWYANWYQPRNLGG